MPILIVVDNPALWPLEVPSVQIVSARAYLTDPVYSEMRATKVFNMCRSYRYQANGYYVSLLAEARGHKPTPGILTAQDIKSQSIIRHVSEELDELIQKSLARIESDTFVLSVYFGRNLAQRYDRLSLHLFNMLPVPLLRAHFHRGTKWNLQHIRPIAASEIPESHRPFVIESALRHFMRPARPKKRHAGRHDLAILVNPEVSPPPSNRGAIAKFVKSAENHGFDVELITKDDYGRIAEFDALFIRETTAVNHHTYRFASRAKAEGLVVIDDPRSILCCTNKVYLAESLRRHGVRTPRTLVVHKDNLSQVEGEVGLPCILKQPDSAFSVGVIKVDSDEELRRESSRLLERSDLIIAQEFLPTPFDWRIAVLDRKPLFACKYHMAKRHWQIIRRDASGNHFYGRVEAIPIEEVPPIVVKTALRAANLIGDGLYGVDLKQVARKVFVIEVNDNPNIDSGYDDQLLKDELYDRVVRVILARVESRGGNANGEPTT